MSILDATYKVWAKDLEVEVTFFDVDLMNPKDAFFIEETLSAILSGLVKKSGCNPDKDRKGFAIKTLSLDGFPFHVEPCSSVESCPQAEHHP